MKFKYWVVAIIIGPLIGAAIWWGPSLVIDSNDPLNKPDVFVYTNNGMLQWFELKLRNGKIDGTLHQQRLIETEDKAPSIDEKIYPVTGEGTKKGYKLVVKTVGTYDAWFSGPHLALQKHGEQDRHLYNPVNQEELASYVDALLGYHKEEKEKNQRRQFLSELPQCLRISSHQ